MSNQKKESKGWYLGITHYLTAAIAVPFLMLILWNFASPILNLFPSYMVLLLSLVYAVLTIFLGVFYSARFICKTYVIENKKTIVKVSTALFVVSQVLIDLYVIAVLNSSFVLKLYWLLYSWYILFGMLVINMLFIAVFYLFSKKYIIEDQITSDRLTEAR